MISVNLSVIFQAAIFIVVVIFLKAFLFKPILALLKERDKKISGTKDEAKTLEEEAGKRVLEIEKMIEITRSEAQKERERRRKEGYNMEENILKEAMEWSRGHIETVTASLADEVTAVRNALKSDVSTMATEIAERILGRKVA